MKQSFVAAVLLGLATQTNAQTAPSDVPTKEQLSAPVTGALRPARKSAIRLSIEPRIPHACVDGTPAEPHADLQGKRKITSHCF